jgi:hypothetical protein
MPLITIERRRRRSLSNHADGVSAPDPQRTREEVQPIVEFANRFHNASLRMFGRGMRSWRVVENCGDGTGSKLRPFRHGAQRHGLHVRISFILKRLYAGGYLTVHLLLCCLVLFLSITASGFRSIIPVSCNRTILFIHFITLCYLQ